MGCDIHAHIELKRRGSDVWEHWNAPRIGRDYALFEKMAGVRGREENAIVPPRGLPEDVSTLTKVNADHEGDDGHTHSYLTRDEIQVLQEWWEKDPCNPKPWNFEVEIMGGYLFGNGYGELPEEIEDVRIVFWFDN